MSGFRILVADDEPLARAMVVEMLRRDPEVDEVAECGDASEVTRAIERLHPDVVFLDVEMPGVDGIQIASSFLPEQPVVVFVTAYGHYAARAFDLRAADYVLKPFSDGRFLEALARAKERAHERRRLGLVRAAPARPRVASAYLERLAFMDGERPVVIGVDQVVWIEAQDYYVRVHSAEQRWLMRATLASLDEQLDPARFMRAHRGAIVNLDAVEASDDQGARLTLKDGTEIAVSRTHRRRVAAALAWRQTSSIKAGR